MSRNIKAAILVAILGLSLAACKKATNYSASTSQNTSITSQGKTAPENLTFSGAVNGKMTEGAKGDTYLCSTVATGPIVGKIGGTDYTFEFRNLNAKGPGTYKAFVQIGPLANKNLYYGTDSVSLTINSDSRSGLVEGDLANLSNASEKVHISGTWTCPADY